VPSLPDGEGQFRRLAENLPVVLYRYRLLPTPRFEYVSPATESLLGYTVEEHYADPALTLRYVHPDDLRGYARIWANTRAFHEPVSIRFVRKDGAVVWVEQRNYPVLDSDGRLVAVEGIVRDVTAEARGREELAESEERYRQLFAASPLPLWVFDPVSLRFLEVNEAAVRTYGYSREEFLAMTLADIRPPEDRDALASDVRVGHPSFGEWRHVKKDGSVIEVAVHARDFRFKGAPARLVLAQDVTDRKQAEESARQSYEALRRSDQRRRWLLDRTVREVEEERARLAAQLHDGPVQRLAALGYRLERLGLGLNRGELEEAGQELEGLRAAIATEIQELRRMMTEMRPPILSERGLGPALRDHAALVSMEAGLKVSVQIEGDGRAGPTVETILYRVAREALLNTVKHARSRRAWIHLRALDEELAMEVGDDGIGFETADMLGPGADRFLGLISMRERVESAGGTWTLHAAPGRGTRIQIRVPTEDVDPGREASLATSDRA